MAAGGQQLPVALLFVVGGVLTFPLVRETKHAANSCGYEVSEASRSGLVGLFALNITS